MSDEDRVSPIRIVQLHDATITGFQVLAGGTVVMSLREVSVYRPVSPQEDDVWVHDATLIMNGVTMLSVDGSWSEGDDHAVGDGHVLTDEIYSTNGERINWLGLDGAEIHYIRLGLFSGACIGVACTRASLSLSEEGEWDGRWEESPAPSG